MIDPLQEAIEEADRVAADKRREQLRVLVDDEALKDMLALKHGRRVIWNILCSCGLYGDPFRGEESHHTSYECGKRAVGIVLLENCLRVAPECYNMMRAEASAQEKNLEGKDGRRDSNRS